MTGDLDNDIDPVNAGASGEAFGDVPEEGTYAGETFHVESNSASSVAILGNIVAQDEAFDDDECPWNPKVDETLQRAAQILSEVNSELHGTVHQH